MAIDDVVENLCIESGIYKYLYVEETYNKLKQWANDRGLEPEECGGKKELNHMLYRYFGRSARFAEIGTIKGLLKCGLFQVKKARNSNLKYLILEIDKKNVWRSLLQNILYIVIYRHCRFISYNKFLRSVGIDENYIRLTKEFSNIIMQDLETYKNNIGIEKEAFYIKRLVADYLQIRDFKNARRYVDILSSKNMDSNGKIARLMENIENALAGLKKIADEKGIKHILWNWVDCVEYARLVFMPFLKKRIENGIDFTHMYCMTPYTTATAQILMTGGMFFEDGLWKLSKSDISKSYLIQYLHEKGYEFSYIGEKYRFDLLLRQDGVDAAWSEVYVPSTVFQYEFLLRAAAANKPTCFLIHNFNETHLPFQNPEKLEIEVKKADSMQWEKEICRTGQISSDYKRQIIRSAQYFDEQLEYYHKYYTKNIRYEILFSDHGQSYYGDRMGTDKRFHVFMGICGDNIVARKVTSMQSLKSFPKIIKYLCEGSQEKIGMDDNEEYVSIQLDDVYGKNKKEKYILLKNIKADYSRFYVLYDVFQFRGIITKEDAYIRWACGYEYYERGEDSENLINDAKWQERIDYLRNLNGNLFIDSFKEHKYKPCKGLYKAMGESMAKNNAYVN